MLACSALPGKPINSAGHHPPPETTKVETRLTYLLLVPRGATMRIEWELIVTSLTALGAAGWAIVKWTGERRKDRLDEEKRLASLYVNPFLFACEELQSRLYNVLCRGGLVPLRKR